MRPDHLPRPSSAEREAALAALPRFTVSPVRDHAALVRRIEDLALEAGDRLRDTRAAGAADWWRHQDMLDDLQDILEHLRARESASGAEVGP